MENQNQPNQPSTTVTPPPQKKQSAAGKILLTAFITALFIGGATFAIMFVFQENQKSSLESSITEKELELQAAQNSLESAETELQETREELEEERMKAEEVEKISNTTPAAEKIITNPALANTPDQKLTIKSGVSFSPTEMSEILYANPNLFEAREGITADQISFVSYVQDGINENVIYVEMSFRENLDNAFNEFYRVDFSNESSPSFLRLFNYNVQNTENASEYKSILGRDRAKLVFVTTDIDDSPGPCANLWLDAEKAANIRTYSYIDLAEVNQRLDATDLTPFLTFEKYIPSNDVILEQTEAQNSCIAELNSDNEL